MIRSPKPAPSGCGEKPYHVCTTPPVDMPQSKNAAASTPQIPHAPCTGNASTGSSTLIFGMSAEAPRYTKPPMMPITTADHDCTLPQPAVMETRPPRIAPHVVGVLHFPVVMRL